MKRTVLLLGVCIGATVASLAAQSGGVSQARLSEWLQGPDQRVREAVVAEVLRIPLSDREPVLQRALITELMRINDELRSRETARKAGKPFPPSILGEYHGALVEAVAGSDDPAIIPALAGALGTGRLAANGLIRFGNAAVGPTALVARVSTSPIAAASALRVLGAILRDPKPLSPESRRLIVESARSRLAGTQYPTVVAAACELAILTKDAELRLRVTDLARSPAAAEALGVRDAELVALVMRRAARALERR